MNNNPNTQLPQSVVHQIKKDSILAVASQIFDYQDDILNNNEVAMREYGLGYEAGATVYSADLHQLQQENEELRGDIQLFKDDVKLYEKEKRELVRQNEKLKEQAAGWRPLLEEFISMHETGLLPNRFTYEKAKKFLYGE